MKQPYIIAEVGNCHEGSLDVALELVDRAKQAGADFVKFQAGRAEGFARTPQDVERYRKYELGEEGYWALVERAAKVGIEPLFSVWNVEFESLFRYPVMWRKIPARQCDRLTIAERANPRTFISIPHWFEEKQVRELDITHGIPMHCVTEYPAKDPMLGRILRLREWTGKPVGYSDHTIGIEAAVAAVKSAGAVAIEKHFTKAHDFGPLRDHALAATPEELKELVKAVK
jgi:N,N'-diacetyllegionaminate synthase